MAYATALPNVYKAHKLFHKTFADSSALFCYDAFLAGTPLGLYNSIVGVAPVTLTTTSSLLLEWFNLKLSRFQINKCSL